MATTTLGKATDFINFSRASLATVTDSDGKVKWAAHNLIDASEAFSSSAWAKTSATVTANSIAAPNGVINADTIAATAANATVLDAYTADAVPYTFGVWLRRKTGTGTIEIAADSGTWVSQTITSSWALYTVTQTPTAGSKSAGIRIGTSGDEVYAWGAHLYRSDLGGMVANTSAYPMYNPTTAKNLLGYTESFDNAAWSKTRASISANTTLAPNGLQTADSLIEDTTASNNHFIAASATLVVGGSYTVSIYLKANTRSFARLVLSDSSVANGVRVDVNLTSGATSSTAFGSGWTIVSSLATSVSDGWYRVSITCSGATSTSCVVVVYPATALGTISYTGDGTSGIYIWGAQLSDSASLDPYISNPFAAPTAGAYHGPRLDYDGSTLAAKGLLVEEQRTNLLVRSEEFDNAAWQAKQAISVTANATTAPSGVATADKIVEDTTSDIHRIGQYNAGLSAVAYAYSVYVKPEGSARRLYVNLVSLAGTGALFDFTGAGSVIASSGTAPNRASSITAVGGGWYRCVVIGTGTATATSAFLQINRTSSSTAADDTYTGDGSSGFSFYGAQLEAGSFATSYIPTTSASVTRSADVAQVGTSAFPYSAVEGTLVASYSVLAVTADQRPVGLWEGSGSNNRAFIFAINGTTYYQVRSSNVDQASFPFAATTAANAITKAAGVYKANDFAATVNGGAVSTDTSGDVPAAVPIMALGSMGGGTYLNGHIRQITYIPRRLSNAELQSRTA